MAALTTAFDNQPKDGVLQSYKVKGSTKIWKGALVGLAGGFLVPMAHGTANLTFAGVAYESVDNSGGTDGDRSCRVQKSGSFLLNTAGGYTAAQGDVGAEVYANTDNEVQKVVTELTNSYKVGSIVEFLAASRLRVRIDPYVK